LSICLSVCPIRPLHSAAAGLLLWAVQAGDVDQLLHDMQQQPHCSSAVLNWACQLTLIDLYNGCKTGGWGWGLHMSLLYNHNLYLNESLQTHVCKMAAIVGSATLSAGVRS